MRLVQHKYGAEATTLDNVRFASKREARRYQELKLLLRAGEIRELELQPVFQLHVPMKGRTNVHVHVCDYVADFRYREGPTGLLVVEDAKGVRTPLYRLKKKMLAAEYGITIREI